MKLFVGGIVLFVLFSQTALAATLEGNVYDIALEPVPNAFVDVSGAGRQQVVARNGTYQFTLEPGTYLLRARELDQGKAVSSATERVTILADDTRAVIDLVLFPVIVEENLNETDLDLASVEDLDLEQPIAWWPGILGASILVLLAAGFFVWFRKSRAEQAAPESQQKPFIVDDEAKGVLSFLKQNSGRATQKEIRKAFPFSEAKISLILTDLESQGLLRKIKQGRSNVVVLAQKE